MHIEDAQAVARAWKERGDPPCLHPALVTEEYTSAGGGVYHTGDWVCVTCGSAFFSQETAQADRERQRARSAVEAPTPARHPNAPDPPFVPDEALVQKIVSVRLQAAYEGARLKARPCPPSSQGDQDAPDPPPTLEDLLAHVAARRAEVTDAPRDAFGIAPRSPFYRIARRDGMAAAFREVERLLGDMLEGPWPGAGG